MSLAHVAGAAVGEMFQTVILNQFERLRDGDRFWYERKGMFTADEIALIYNTVRSGRLAPANAYAVDESGWDWTDSDGHCQPQSERYQMGQPVWRDLLAPATLPCQRWCVPPTKSAATCFPPLLIAAVFP